MNTIQHGWAQLESLIPPNASPHQRRVMKLFFYAGAQHMLRIAWNLGRINESAAIAILQGLMEEGDQFTRDYLNGAVIPPEHIETFMALSKGARIKRG